MFLHAVLPLSGRRTVTQAAMPMIGMIVFTRAGSRRVTIKPANRHEPPIISAAQDGLGDSPLSRAFNTSAPTTASASSSGPARTNHPKPAARAATNVDATIPTATRMLGVRSRQYFRVMPLVPPPFECAWRGFVEAIFPHQTALSNASAGARARSQPGFWLSRGETRAALFPYAGVDFAGVHAQRGA